MTAKQSRETALPQTDENGLAVSNGLPLNRLKRAEALAARGDSEDPEGIVSPDAIAGAKARRAQLDKAAKADKPKAEKVETETPAKPGKES